MKKRTDECAISKTAFGEHLRALRKQAGFRNTESFAEAMTEIAGYHVSKETVYRIESGKQEASISFVCAASIALHGKILSFPIDRLLRASACEEWQLIEEETERKAAEAHRKAEAAIREMMKRENLSTYEAEDGTIYF